MPRPVAKPAADQPEPVARLTRRGVAAALAVARAQGLPDGDPRLLSARGNTIVHLAPAPVVARVSTLTAWTRADPAAWLAREVAVAGYAAARGGPVVAPAPLARPGPHESDGLAVTLWELAAPPAAAEGTVAAAEGTVAGAGTPGGATPRATAAEAGRALAGLHRAAAGYPGSLPVLVTVHDLIIEGLARLAGAGTLARPVLDELARVHAEVLADLGPAATDHGIVLHGDAHGGNLLATRDGWKWADLEETCRGPREFDLAVLRHWAGPDGAAALAAYAAAGGTPEPDPALLAACSRARELEGAVWSLGMAHQYPQRYQEPSRVLLSRLLSPDLAATI